MIRNKIYSLGMYGKPLEVKLEFQKYPDNGKLSLALRRKADADMLKNLAPGCDPFLLMCGHATRNLPESKWLGPSTQFVNEECFPGIGKWLEENRIARPTTDIAFSMDGKRRYQAYKFFFEDEEMKIMWPKKSANGFKRTGLQIP